MRDVFSRAVRVFFVGAVVLGLAWLAWKQKVDTSARDRVVSDASKALSALEAGPSGDAGALVPAPRRAVKGHLRSADGKPIDKATVNLFPDARSWLDGDGRTACATSLFLCGTRAAGQDVLTRHAAGTLSLPVPLTTTTTDAEGGFHFDDAPGDGFVFAWKGDVRALAGLERLDDLELTGDVPAHEDYRVSDADDLGVPGATITAIDPLTGESLRGLTDEQGHFTVTLVGPLLWAAAEKAGLQTEFSWKSPSLTLTTPRSLHVRLGAAEGPIDGLVRLSCVGTPVDERQTKNAEVTFDDIAGTRCALSAQTSTHVARKEFFDHPGGRLERSVALLPAARLSLTLSSQHDDGPVPAGVVTLSGPRSTTEYLNFAAGERISFSPTAAGPISLRIEVSGFARRVVDVTLPPGDTHREETLERQVELSGLIVLADGRPAEHAMVQVHLPGRRGASFQSAVSDGGFAMSVDGPGPWQLKALHQTEGVATSLATTPGPQPVMRLGLRGVLTVDARTDKGATLTALGSLAFFEAKRFRSIGTLGWREDGTARVIGLAPGQYRLRVAEDGWLPVERLLSLAEGQQRREVVRLSRGESVSGVVVDERGQPQGGVTVVVNFQQRAVSASDGTFLVQGLAAGKATLRTESSSSDVESLSRDIVVPASRLTLVLRQARLRWGRVVDETGAPVTAFAINGRDFRADDGRFKLTLGRDGALKLSALGQAKYFENLPEGDMGDLVIRKPVSLRGHVRHADGRNAVGIEVVAQGTSERTDGNGDFRFEDQPGARVRAVAIDDEGYAIMELGTDGVTEATLVPLLELSGEVVDARGTGTRARVFARLQAEGLDASSQRFETDERGQFTQRLRPGLWRFETDDGRVGLANVERSGQHVRVGPAAACSLELFPVIGLGDSVVTVRRGQEFSLTLTLSGSASLPLSCGRYQVSALLGDGGVWRNDVELVERVDRTEVWVGGRPEAP